MSLFPSGKAAHHVCPQTDTDADSHVMEMHSERGFISYSYARNAAFVFVAVAACGGATVWLRSRYFQNRLFRGVAEDSSDMDSAAHTGLDPQSDAGDLPTKPAKPATQLKYDIGLVPPLYAVGCEDTYNWTNGYSGCMKQEASSAEGNRPLCQLAGYTCAAYKKKGFCKDASLLGKAYNYPEHNCCACGGGATVDKLSSRCKGLSIHCKRYSTWAKRVGIYVHPEWFHGLTAQSNLEDFQRALVIDPVSECQQQCGVEPECNTTHEGDECYEHVHWAMHVGIRKHPEWYKGLDRNSSLVDFQRHLAMRGVQECPLPCEHDAQAHAKECKRPAYSGPHHGDAFCFAQLASNSGATGKPCACSGGCNLAEVLLASTINTVSFKSSELMHHIHNACSQNILVTIPRGYYADYTDIKEQCGQSGMIDTFEHLLTDGFDAFNMKVCDSALWQCVSSPQNSSVPYLHLFSFAASGYFQALPTSNSRVASCVRQKHRGESRVLAIKLAALTL